MSFALTTDQVRAQTKNVTRRLGWKNLKPGDCFRMVVKAMGLKKGEKVEEIGYGRCVRNDREPLASIVDYPPNETAREGFPGLSPEGFVEMFVTNMRCEPLIVLGRIEFEYVTKDVAEAWERSRPKSRKQKDVA